MRNTILKLVKQIVPVDDLEWKHQQDAISWIESGAPIFRLEKPAVPNKHLVAYFVVVDVDAQKVLLVHHKKAQRWLPTGGHVELDENPLDTLRRECLEELGVELPLLFEEPIFVTQTETVGLTAGHIDVSVWYVVKGVTDSRYEYDEDEFLDLKWFALDELPFDESDPHLRRFMNKLKQMDVLHAEIV